VLSRRPKRVAILGAGPIGLEAALYAVELGHDVQLYERGTVGENVRSWGHVQMFSPWGINRSPLGSRVLADAGVEPEPDDLCPTGAAYVDRYLAPLAGSPRLARRIDERHVVRCVGRERIGKPDLVGGPRHRHSFRVLLDGPDGERIEHADVVLDCTGTYGRPNWFGNGGVPALGERALRHRIDYTLRDITGEARPRFAGRRVLLVGGGHSAATALDALVRLASTRVVWVVRSDRDPPLPEIEDDPLPERRRLSHLANELAWGADPRVEFHRSTVVERVAERGGGFDVELSSHGASDVVQVDRILAHVGYQPDNSIYRELQIHECYASFGPIKLAATLLAGDATDCLAGASAGPETLRNPEPDFFVLGAKSYGKHSNFLIRTGLGQVRDVFALIEDDPGLDLYRGPTRTGVRTTTATSWNR
jgi:thioredoxin reductase